MWCVYGVKASMPLNPTMIHTSHFETTVSHNETLYRFGTEAPGLGGCGSGWGLGVRVGKGGSLGPRWE